MSNKNKFDEINQGIGLLIGCHVIAGFIIVILGYIFGIFAGILSEIGIIERRINSGVSFEEWVMIGVWLYGFLGLPIWQLFYVIPLTIRLKRRGNINKIKGVIIGAVLTALLLGPCMAVLLPLKIN